MRVENYEINHILPKSFKKKYIHTHDIIPTSTETNNLLQRFPI